MPETPPLKDGVALVADGTIRCTIDGEERKVRRVTTGEYKRFRLASRARDDELEEMRQDAKASLEPEGDETPEGEERQRLLQLARDLGRRIDDRAGELDRAWFRMVFNGDDEHAGLADKPLPDDADEWPVWLWQPANVTKLLEHWRADPLAPGPQ